jgi:hypothetical protein
MARLPLRILGQAARASPGTASHRQKPGGECTRPPPFPAQPATFFPAAHIDQIWKAVAAITG